MSPTAVLKKLITTNPLASLTDPAARLLLLLIAEANAAGEVSLPNSTLSNKSGISEASVTRGLRDLIASKVITRTVVGGGRSNSVYQFNGQSERPKSSNKKRHKASDYRPPRWFNSVAKANVSDKRLLKAKDSNRVDATQDPQNDRWSYAVPSVIEYLRRSGDHTDADKITAAFKRENEPRIGENQPQEQRTPLNP